MEEKSWGFRTHHLEKREVSGAWGRRCFPKGVEIELGLAGLFVKWPNWKIICFVVVLSSYY